MHNMEQSAIKTQVMLRRFLVDARSKFTATSQSVAGATASASATAVPPPVAVTMELSHSLTLNEEAYAKVPDQQKPVFLFEWLRYLDRVLVVALKSDIKSCQKKLVEQLTAHIQSSPGPPTRKLIASCLATLFSVGDTFLLFDTVNKCNDILKNKDDSPSVLATKLCAICCLGSMYEKLGRMMGRSYEETIAILTRSLKSAESQMRIEIMLTLQKVCAGMDTAIANTHKDIYKATKYCLTDRVQAVRVAAARCLRELLNHAPFLYTIELESLAALCFRAFDGSNYEVRCAVADLLGNVIALTQLPHSGRGPPPLVAGKPMRVTSLDEALGVLMSGFLRGGTSFLKGTGEMIKGSSGINREVRVGVTHAYVVFVRVMGSVWLERNLSAFTVHVLDLVANPKAAASHVDAVYSRKCINFILRSVIGKLLGEKAQTSACKELVLLMAKQMNSIDFSPENAKDCNQETLFSQHLLVCALQELGALILSLGTTAQVLLVDGALHLVDAVCAVLVHPCSAARLAAAWCLRCVCVAVPAQITPLIDRCVEAVLTMETVPEAIAGYSGALAAVLGAVRYSPLGVPHSKGKVVFNTAEHLLRKASQNSRLSLFRIQAGWLLIGATMTLGVPVVKGLLLRMLRLCRNSFPLSDTELESEKARGDAFTWQVTLESRAGALSVMHSFLLHCSELLTDDIPERFLRTIDSALTMLVGLNPILKSYGQHLKAPVAMVRLRLYETLAQLPPSMLEFFFSHTRTNPAAPPAAAAGAPGSSGPPASADQQKRYNKFTHLLQMLVSEFTLSDNPANTTSSLLRQLCHADDSIVLGTWLQETDHRTIEDQLQSNSAAGSGALEHDPCCLYRPLATSEPYPGPLPLGVAVINTSIALFGQIFPRSANKHRITMFNHFGDCIKQAKSARQEAVQMNVFAALLSGLRGLNESKAAVGAEDVQRAAIALILGALCSPNALLKCAAGEASGKMAAVVGDSKFTAELAQTSFDRLKSARDVATRTGHSLALGCLHKNVGGMGSGQHLNMSVSILLALAQDATSPEVQVWALYALSLIADSGGPMFRAYVEPALSLAIRLLLSVPQSLVGVHQCVGRVLAAVLTTMGPELQSNTAQIATMRSSFLCACAIMQSHYDPLVQAEATGCLQQLHLFAPRHVNLSSLVPAMVRTLFSNYLLLRKAAVSCLRQLSQREAREVCEHAAQSCAADSGGSPVGGAAAGSGVAAPAASSSEYGLPGILFAMLDTETDAEMIRNIHDTIASMLQMLAAGNCTQWLSLCKKVLTVANEAGGADAAAGADGATGGAAAAGASAAAASKKPSALVSADGLGNDDDAEDDEDAEDDDENDDDVADFRVGESQSTHPAVQPRWPTRVFAAECIRRIIRTCESAGPIHFDLVMAKRLRAQSNSRGGVSGGDFLILHLSDLIRIAFMAATSHSDQLRLEGLKLLQDIIEKFARVPEPEFPGHVLLEQYQAQVGAALRPAFSADTPSHVTAAACEVCSAWIGSGVARDLNDLRRVHQLLVSSLAKLHQQTNSTQLYNESMATLEKLSILKAWAEVYIVAMVGNGSAPASALAKRLSSSTMTTTTTTSVKPSAADDDDFGDFESQGESLLQLVQPELGSLSQHWLAALKDHALLQLPAEYASQLPANGGAFYTKETLNSAKPHYRASWSPILYAAALWLNGGGFVTDGSADAEQDVQNGNAPAGGAGLDNNGDADSSGHSASAPITHGSPSADRFHLVFGIAMEALCSTRSSEKLDKVIACLQAIYTLFESGWARALLFRKRKLAVELCCVLHRLILTRDSPDVQLLAVEVLRRSLDGAKEALQAAREERLGAVEDNEQRTLAARQADEELGEGGVDGGQLQPGDSYVYAVLEVCLCLFVRQIPTMNPASGAKLTCDQLQQQLRRERNAKLATPTRQLGEDGGVLVARALGALEALPQLCSPAGAVQVLPTILFLAIGVLKEVGLKEPEAAEGGAGGGAAGSVANTAAVVAVLHVFRAMLSDRYAVDERSAAQWKRFVQSTLAALLDLTKTAATAAGAEGGGGSAATTPGAAAPAEAAMDEVTMMAAIAVFIRHAPPKFCAASGLKFPCINHFQQCLQPSAGDAVRLRCVQTLRGIFVSAELKVARPYIHALAPRIVEALCATGAREPRSEAELAVTLEGVQTVEALIVLAEPQNRIQMLTILVPILVSYLLPAAQLATATKLRLSLHSHSLQWLMKIGPRYPAEFKALMAEAPELRAQLEAAVRAQQQLGTQSSLKGRHDAHNSARAAAAAAASSAPVRPIIQLKMDFSNFTAPTANAKPATAAASGTADVGQSP